MIGLLWAAAAGRLLDRCDSVPRWHNTPVQIFAGEDPCGGPFSAMSEQHIRPNKCALVSVAATCIWLMSSQMCSAVTPHPGFDVAMSNGNIVVTMVYADTPADILGIQKGDVIVKVNNAKATMESLNKVFSHKRVGSDMHMAFQRDNEVRDLEVRLIDKDKPDSWAAAAAAVEKKLLQDYRDSMDRFMVKYGPVQILGAELVRDSAHAKIAVRIANVSEHFLEACELEVLVLDSDGKPVTFPDQHDPIHIFSIRELKPANPAGTHGTMVVESKQDVATSGVTTAVVTVKHARLADGRDYKSQEPQKVIVKR